MNQTGKETFEDFIKSFFYGSRSDLTFKFMADYSEEQASDFLRGLFATLVDAVDDNDLDAVKDAVMAGQIQGYSSGQLNGFTYETGPFTPMKKPVAKAKLSLLTSSGHFVAGNDPRPLGVADMTQAEAEARIMEFIKEPPQLSVIPFDTPGDRLRVRHGGYDIRGAHKDPNCALPLERMNELRDKGRFRALTPDAYSFVGACAQKRLLKETLPGWATSMKETGADAVVLVPV